MSTFDDFGTRLEELWDAIKFENFVFGFKNVLAYEAHKKLMDEFDQEQWGLKCVVRKMIEDEESVGEKLMDFQQQDEDVDEFITKSNIKIMSQLSERGDVVREKIRHYFRCTSGCSDCNINIQNRHLLSKYEQDFEDDCDALQKSLKREVDSTLEKLEVRLNANKQIIQMDAEINILLKDGFKEPIKKHKALHSGTTDAEELFNEWWKEQVSSTQRKIKNTLKPVNVNTMVQGVIVKALKNDNHLYLRARSQDDSSKLKRNSFGRKTERKKLRRADCTQELPSFAVKKKHLNMKDPFKRSDEQGIQQLQKISENIIEGTMKYYDSTTPVKGKEFTSKDAERLFDDVLRQIKEIEEERFDVTKKYKIDLVLYIESQAIEGFKTKHEVYIKENSPQALLEKKRRLCYDIFMAEMGRGDLAVTFSQSALKEIILENITRKLSGSDLLTDLREHCGGMFKNVKNLQAAILIDLLHEDSFYSFVEFITNYEDFVVTTLYEKSTEYFKQGNRLKEIMKEHMEHLIHTILEAVEKTVENPSDDLHFFQTFFTNIKELIIPSDCSLLAVLPAPVPDRKKFGSFIRKQLLGPVKEQLLKRIEFSNEGTILDRIHLANFIFNEVVSCREKCPFCSVPCDAHSGSNNHGSHSATLHRPTGLSGYKQKGYILNTRLFTENCNSLIGSQEQFSNIGMQKMKKFRSYQKYYPKWRIHAEANQDVEKYWKYVFARYNTKFAAYYGAREEKVPEEWNDFKIDEVVSELKGNYDIEDISGTHRCTQC